MSKVGNKTFNSLYLNCHLELWGICKREFAKIFYYRRMQMIWVMQGSNVLRALWFQRFISLDYHRGMKNVWIIIWKQLWILWTNAHMELWVRLLPNLRSIMFSENNVKVKGFVKFLLTIRRFFQVIAKIYLRIDKLEEAWNTVSLKLMLLLFVIIIKIMISLQFLCYEELFKVLRPKSYLHILLLAGIFSLC